MRNIHIKKRQTSIFRAIFVPLFLIMILQGAIFYFSAVYGGVESSLNQNAADILGERLTNRKNEIETKVTKDWNDMDSKEKELNALYKKYEESYGPNPFVGNEELQVQFLDEATETLTFMIRDNYVNGVFLILNDKDSDTGFSAKGEEQKYGLCIRDMDATSAYTGTEDLLIERSPASIVDKIGCSLDSWWEARYTFASEEEGSYFYEPIRAAWENPGAQGEDIAYFCGAHAISDSDAEVVSYSIPLIDENGHPYGVLGVELTTKYLASLMPNKELNDADKSCYILALKSADGTECTPITASGALYNRCFGSESLIDCGDKVQTGGFEIPGPKDVVLYGQLSKINIYNNNNPFENTELVLMAIVQKDALFYYSKHVRQTLLMVSAISLAIGVLGIFVASHSFAAPITSLAKKARNMKPQDGVHLEHLGINEIDQLVDSIEGLNENVSKEVARTEFFSRMSHDMRTPMNAIISFSSEEMLEGANEELKNDYLTKIHASGVYLLGLINEVLDMTKIESNKVDLHFESVKAVAIWDTVISIVDKLAQKQDILFIKNIEVDKELYVNADVQHLNQIVMNLLSNAVKFTPEHGTVTLEIKMPKLEEKKTLCTIQVSDTGSGMSEEFMKKLYTPFEQEHSGQGGTGLGLSIVKKLVDLLGGSISCDSKKNEGTRFLVTLPLEIGEKKNNEKQMEEILEEAQADNLAMQGKRVLLCEDNELNMQIARKLLERKQILVETAENGKEGMEKFEKSPENYFDAILMDIRMPVLDGLGAAKGIRGMKREDSSIPIIAMTANAFEEDIRQSSSAGMNEHLSKPIEPDKLYQTLAKYLKQY